jgi:hypothetical protein
VAAAVVVVSRHRVVEQGADMLPQHLPQLAERFTQSLSALAALVAAAQAVAVAMEAHRKLLRRHLRSLYLHWVAALDRRVVVVSKVVAEAVEARADTQPPTQCFRRAILVVLATQHSTAQAVVVVAQALLAVTHHLHLSHLVLLETAETG